MKFSFVKDLYLQEQLFFLDYFEAHKCNFSFFNFNIVGLLNNDYCLLLCMYVFAKCV